MHNLSEAWPATLFWYRAGQPMTTTGEAIEQDDRLAVTLPSAVPWFPEETVYVARGTGADRQIGVGHVVGGADRAVVVELLAPWRRYNRRRDRRYVAQLRTVVVEPETSIVQRGRILNLSLGGMRIAVPTPPRSMILDVTLTALDNSTVLACDVQSIENDGSGYEVRVRFREVTAQSLVALHAILSAMHVAEEQRAPFLAA